MWIVTLLLVLLFGWFWSVPATEVSMQADVQTQTEVVSVAEEFSVEGEPATALGVEPVSERATYAVTTSGVWMARDDGSWQRSGPSIAHESVIVDSRDDTLLWAGTGMECYRGGGSQGSLAQSTDGGATWTEAGPEGLVPLASWMNTGVVIAHDCSGLQVSTDSGQTWSVPEGYPLGSQVTAFTVAATPESAEGLSVLVGVTGEGGTSQLYRVMVSGFDPPVVSDPLATYYGIGSVGVLSDGAYLLGAPHGVMRSDDRGATWTVFRGGLEETTLEQDPIEAFPEDIEPGSFGLPSMLIDGETEYVAGVEGIYRWSDDAYSWELIAPMEFDIVRMALAPDEGTLLATDRNGDVLRVVVD